MRARAAIASSALLVACAGGEQRPHAPGAAGPMRPAALEREPGAPGLGAPMAEKQRAAIESIARATNAHDPARIAAAYAPDATLETAPGEGAAQGRDEIERVQQVSFDAFPNMRVGIRRAFFVGSNAIVEWVTNGTHDGDFLGLEPTHRKTGVVSANVYDFTPEGLVSKERVYSDEATLLAQLAGRDEADAAIPRMPERATLLAANGSPAEHANVAWGKGLYDAWDSSRRSESAAKIGSMLADDFTFELAMAPDAPLDKDAFVRTFTKIAHAVPDAEYEVTRAWGVGSFGIFEYTLRGTQRGDISDVGATDRPVAWHWLEIFEIKDGKATRGWGYANMLELLAELGAIGP